jgi:hypothetical protein
MHLRAFAYFGSISLGFNVLSIIYDTLCKTWPESKTTHDE